MALTQSGWAIKYVPHPSEELQLLAVSKNFDAIKYIDNPSQKVQDAAARLNYRALQYIQSPTLQTKCTAVKTSEQALQLMSDVTKEQFLTFLGINILVIKYIPRNIAITTEEIKEVLQRVLSREDVDEDYVRNYVNSGAIDTFTGMMPLAKLMFIYETGSKKTKKMTVDERLKTN